MIWYNFVLWRDELPHCGLMLPYGLRDLGHPCSIIDWLHIQHHSHIPLRQRVDVWGALRYKHSDQSTWALIQP